MERERWDCIELLCGRRRTVAESRGNISRGIIAREEKKKEEKRSPAFPHVRVPLHSIRNVKLFELITTLSLIPRWPCARIMILVRTDWYRGIILEREGLPRRRRHILT